MFSILESPPPGARIDVVRAANSGPWGDEVRICVVRPHVPTKRLLTSAQHTHTQNHTQNHIVCAVRLHSHTPAQVEARLTKLDAAGSVRTHVLEKAGHWVQMDNPSGLAKLMAPSFGLVE